MAETRIFCLLILIEQSIQHPSFNQKFKMADKTSLAGLLDSHDEKAWQLGNGEMKVAISMTSLKSLKSTAI